LTLRLRGRGTDRCTDIPEVIMGRLTKTAVEAIEATGGDVLWWDDDLARFGVRVTPGGARSYVIQYRQGGRSRRHTIGRHGQPWTVEQARKEAARLLLEVDAGRDPAAA